MEAWDKDYVDMEVKAFIAVKKHSDGEFQFGLNRCDIDWRITKYASEERLEFTFMGTEENDLVSGRGWMKLTGKNTAEGEFLFHEGDTSTFTAKKQNRPKIP